MESKDNNVGGKRGLDINDRFMMANTADADCAVTVAAV